MTQTKDQQAQEYAEKKMENVYSQEWDSEYVEGLIECAFEDGYTACEQSMWRSAEEELPEFGQKVIVRASCESINGKQYEIHESLKFESIKSFGNTFKLRESANKGIKYKITHFMYIPSLPETNTEKI